MAYSRCGILFLTPIEEVPGFKPFRQFPQNRIFPVLHHFTVIFIALMTLFIHKRKFTVFCGLIFA
jgi:hypothetical protein